MDIHIYMNADLHTYLRITTNKYIYMHKQRHTKQKYTCSHMTPEKLLNDILQTLIIYSTSHPKPMF